jgi:hypothetical protein
MIKDDYKTMPIATLLDNAISQRIHEAVDEKLYYFQAQVTDCDQHAAYKVFSPQEQERIIKELKKNVLDKLGAFERKENKKEGNIGFSDLVKMSGVSANTLSQPLEDFIKKYVVKNSLLAIKEKKILIRFIGAINGDFWQAKTVLPQLKQTLKFGVFSPDFSELLSDEMTKTLAHVIEDNKKIHDAYQSFLKKIKDRLGEKLMGYYKPQFSKWLHTETPKYLHNMHQPGSMAASPSSPTCLEDQKKLEESFISQKAALAAYYGVPFQEFEWEKVNQILFDQAFRKHFSEAIKEEKDRAQLARKECRKREGKDIWKECVESYQIQLTKYMETYRKLERIKRQAQKKLKSVIGVDELSEEFSKLKFYDLEALKRFILTHEIILNFNEAPGIIFDSRTYALDIESLVQWIETEKNRLFKNENWIPKFNDLVQCLAAQSTSSSLFEAPFSQAQSKKIQRIKYDIIKQFGDYYNGKRQTDDHKKKAEKFLRECTEKNLLNQSVSVFLETLCRVQYRPLKRDSKYTVLYYESVHRLQACLEEDELLIDPDFQVTPSVDSKEQVPTSPPAFNPFAEIAGVDSKAVLAPLLPEAPFVPPSHDPVLPEFYEHIEPGEIGGINPELVPEEEDEPGAASEVVAHNSSISVGPQVCFIPEIESPSNKVEKVEEAKKSELTQLSVVVNSNKKSKEKSSAPLALT